MLALFEVLNEEGLGQVLGQHGSKAAMTLQATLQYFNQVELVVLCNTNDLLSS